MKFEQILTGNCIYLNKSNAIRLATFLLFMVGSFFIHFENVHAQSGSKVLAPTVTNVMSPSRIEDADGNTAVDAQTVNGASDEVSITAGGEQRLLIDNDFIKLYNDGIETLVVTEENNWQIKGRWCEVFSPMDPHFTARANMGAGLVSMGYNDGGDYAYLQGGYWGGSDYKPLILQGGGGNVGVGTATPRERLEVNGCILLDVTPEPDWDTQTRLWGKTWDPVEKDGGAHYDSYQHFFDVGSSRTRAISILSNGKVGIGTSEPQVELDVEGTTRTKILTITGGSDLAEPFDVSDDDVIPGMVLSIDPENVGKLKPCDKAYDSAVAGVVSGAGGVNTGMLMSQAGKLDGSHPVALTGRVYCLCDATSGAIKPGDRLTTSPVKGYAMKVSDRDRAAGAVIGKAMSSLESGKGLVLVLIQPQ